MAEEENKPKRYRRTNVDIQADIIKAAESLIKKKGFASMLVTELIKKARVEPLVFYNRYDNLREFYDEFVKRYDYWFKDILTGVQFPTDSELGYISIFKDVQKALQDKSVMLELLRWEIAEGNETTVRTAMLREMHTLPLVNIYEEKFKDTGIDISAISSLIIGGIYYGSVLKPSCKLPPHAHNFISLYRKNGISVTPLNCALKALTFALKDSAFALVALLTKKLSMVS